MSTINVLIDNRWQGNTGIGRVLKEVVERKPANVFATFINRGYPLGHPLSPLYLQKEIRKSNAAMFYSPSFMPPLFSLKPFVITIHDLNHLYFYSKLHKVYFKYIIAQIAKQAKSIITVSEYTKKEILSKLNIKENKIHVIYNGVDSSYLVNKDKYIIERPYFLYVGNRRKYKNLERMLHAFAFAKISKDYLLLMTGYIDGNLEKIINELGIANKIHFLGDVNESDLPKIYKGAHALLFVSLMEGFGLPIIEAMASGTPVITSNITSLPEIAGDAALLVDPFNIEDIKHAIELVANGKTLNDDMIGRGIERCKQFNWIITAGQTWDVILK